MPDNIVRTISTVPEDSRIAWAGMQDGGPLRFAFGWKSDSNGRGEFNFQKTAWPLAWSWGQVNDVLPLGANQAWVATEDGYLVDCRYTDTGIAVQPHYFPGKRFRKLIQDISGNLWCATVDGITLITHNYISALPLAAPYALSDITAMVCDRQNNLYFTQGAMLYKGSLLRPESIKAVLNAKAPITCLHADTAGRIWIGTLGAGLWCGEGSRFREIHDVPKLLAGQILDISGIGNRLWVSSLNGVEEIVLPSGAAPGRVIHHGKHTGAGSDYVYQLFPDSKGNMWMATDGAGICMYDGVRYHHWDSASGFNSKVVYSITEDATGHIWAATLGKGLYEYADGTWNHIDQQQGLGRSNIRHCR